METLRNSDRAIWDYTSDNVGEAGEGGSMRSFAAEEAWNAGLGNCLGVKSGPLPTTRIHSGKPFKWRQREFTTIGLLGWVTVLSVWILPASAVFLQFQNCLSDDYKSSTPLKLQFIPKFVNVTFSQDSSHNLSVTVYGNVNGTGPAQLVVEQPANNTDYWNSNQTNLGGKIDRQPDLNVGRLTTLLSSVKVATYEPYQAKPRDFCRDALQNGECPLGPVFEGNMSDPLIFPYFGFSNNFYSTYAFTSFTATLIVQNGDLAATALACISTNITPDLGSRLSNVLTYVPLVVLVFVGIATAFAAIYSPWGTTDVFRWTTNYGRDPDLLRLVTPGFGDCLQYLQFIALTGGLTLQYPGFYQPVVSKVAWSSLMFNQSFVSGGRGVDSVVDGVYATNGLYGMDVFRQLVGMNAVEDVWAGMVIWLLVIIGAVLAIVQIGFLLRWLSRAINKTHEEDLRAKNMPFSMGNVIRIVFNYFLLPAVALSMFQLVEATESPIFAVALAVVMLALILGFAAWLLYFIASTRPRSFLFDDLPTVLLYGSLYNTYSDNAAPFALIPVLLTFVRGIAIGAVQPSGIAQLVILAICEVITILSLHAFRPFHSPTSMNAFQTIFAILRGAVVLLMIAFSPSLGVTEGPKAWVGYAILLIHAVVLLLGFLLNAMQTIVEVAARMAGAGGDDNGAARGGFTKVFGMRQLSRRLPRSNTASRQSQLSSTGMLDAEDRKSYLMNDGRFRSQSAGSQAILLNRQSTGGLDNIDAFGPIPSHQLDNRASSYTPTTPGELSTFSFLPTAPAPSQHGTPLGFVGDNTADPYYRPPRYRRPTLEAGSPGATSGGSFMSGEVANKTWQQESSNMDRIETYEGQSASGRATPVQQMSLNNKTSPSHRRSQADYTTRESDFYYGVRGPALNANVTGRRIKTGPSDPTGIPSSTLGWVKGLFGGKTKEKGKGFEVVRSARMPPGMNARNSPPEAGVPEGLPVATEGVRNGPIDSDDESDGPAPTHPTAVGALKSHGADGHESDNLVSPLGSDDEYSDGDEDYQVNRISDIPPMLPGIEVGQDGIELPSRFPSKATSRGSSAGRRDMSDMTDIPLVPDIPSRSPTVPRKSSRRKSQSVDLKDLSSVFNQEAQNSIHHMPHRSMDSRLASSQNGPGSSVSAKSSIEAGGQEYSALGRFSANFRDDRPTSVGYVNQHSIHTINPSENPEFLGSSAEVVDSHSGASSIRNQRH